MLKSESEDKAEILIFKIGYDYLLIKLVITPIIILFIAEKNNYTDMRQRTYSLPTSQGSI